MATVVLVPMLVVVSSHLGPEVLIKDVGGSDRQCEELADGVVG